MPVEISQSSFSMLDSLLTDNILEQTSLNPKLPISNLENYFRIYRLTSCILYETGFSKKRNFLGNDKLPRAPSIICDFKSNAQ